MHEDGTTFTGLELKGDDHSSGPGACWPVHIRYDISRKGRISDSVMCTYDANSATETNAPGGLPRSSLIFCSKRCAARRLRPVMLITSFGKTTILLGASLFILKVDFILFGAFCVKCDIKGLLRSKQVVEFLPCADDI